MLLIMDNIRLQMQDILMIILIIVSGDNETHKHTYITETVLKSFHTTNEEDES